MSDAEADMLTRRRRSRGLREEAAKLLRGHGAARGFGAASFGVNAPPLAPPLPRSAASPPLSPQRLSNQSDGDEARLSQLRNVARSFVEAPPPDRRDALQRLHSDAMELMDSAAGAAADSAPPRAGTGSTLPHGRYTAMRIRRDKQRLEQQYLAAMSFLNRADAGDADVLVEEHEFADADAETAAAADKRQLQNYAREAMSFLDKAFNQDESVLIEDGEGSASESEDEYAARVPHFRRVESRMVEPADAESIAQDRANLERYAEEYADFLDKALDGSELIDDTESQASASDRGLYGRRVLPPSVSSQTIEDDLSEAGTDDEFQDPALTEPSPSPVAQQSSESWRDEQDVRRRMQRYEQEAGAYFEDTNVSDGDDDDRADGRRPTRRGRSQNQQSMGLQSGHLSTRLRMEQYAEDAGVLFDDANVSDEDDRLGEEEARAVRGNSQFETPTERKASNHNEFVDDDTFDADQQVVDEEDVTDEVIDSESEGNTSSSTPQNRGMSETSKLLRQRSRTMGRPPTMPHMTRPHRRPLPDTRPPTVPGGDNMMVNIVLTGGKGGSRELEEVALERSFFRKIPRGTTVQILPRRTTVTFPDRDENDDMYEGDTNDNRMVPAAVEEELKKIASERDAVIAALEEIVNERSMLAAQVGEMKVMISQAVGKSITPSRSEEDFDIAGELYSAYEFMRTMTEETEDTINFLEAKQRKMESENKHLERIAIEREDQVEELTIQMERLLRVNKATKECTSCKTLANVTSDLEVARMEVKEVELRNGELHDQLVVAKRELVSKQEAIVAEKESRTNEKHLLEDRCAQLQAGWDEDVLTIRDLTQKSSDAERRAKQLQSALEATESSLLRERVEASRGDTEVAEKMEQLKSEVEAAEKAARTARQAATAADVDARTLRANLDEMDMKMQRSELEVNRLRRELDKVSVENDMAQAELKSTRTKYEDSVKARAASAATNLEAAQARQTIEELKRAARLRDDHMRKQMRELKEHADRAVSAAQTAEKNAGDAANTAATARSNAQDQIDLERRARVAAERKVKELSTQVEAVRSESKAWEKYAREKADQLVEESVSSASLNPGRSGSRRAISNLVASGSKRGDARKNGQGRQDRTGGRMHRPTTSASPAVSVDDGSTAPRKKGHRRLFR